MYKNSQYAANSKGSEGKHVYLKIKLYKYFEMLMFIRI